MSEPLVLASQHGAVATLTLNRPEALNSFTAALHRELAAALDKVESDAKVRCLVLTGAGRGFCAGQDLADPAMAAGTGAGVAYVLDHFYRPLVLRLRAMPVPVIAAVNGVAAGAGVSVALGCDIVIATRSASFIQAFAKIGLIPDAGGTWLLPRLIGRARALALAMTAERLTADEAERIGLIARCVDDAAFSTEVQALAERLAAMPVAALVATRAAFDAAQHLELADALDRESDVQSRLAAAPDALEGVAAFKAKRAPVFGDR